MKNKLKTKKAAAKRIKKTGNKKYMQRTCGQDHFNSRESGKITTAKRKDKVITKTLSSHLKRLLPYS